ncbi:unnamed protein product [Cyprideis torosa]|uniref:LisH domain-containing protein n=1 Tax=Cyprideis torosa TaxID=163714 RepID=A0A7R8ZUR8_9CRUS|nr:unnamed protein product [Cyprideis torosa]CAG0901343.1 unnamed protein product [Cyprideis torosa]
MVDRGALYRAIEEGIRAGMECSSARQEGLSIQAVDLRQNERTAYDNLVSLVPPQLAETASALLHASLAPATQRAYRKAWAKFLRFREKTFAFRKQDVIDTTQMLSFVASLLQEGLAGPTIMVHVAAVSRELRLMGKTDVTKTAPIEAAVRGLRNLRPTRDSRLAITVEIIFLGQDALSLTLRYVEHKSVFHSRLIFQALRFLASFLCHKKICLDFLHARGIEKLLTLPRPSVAATGTSMCFYYLTCSEEAMEELHHYPRAMLQQLVAFMLWLLECSHETARVYAVMSFGTFFQYKTFLSLFDEQDGLRLMYNMVATFKLLDPDVQDTLSEEESLLSRQAIRQIAVALRSYFDAHLVLLIKESSDLTASRQPLATAGAKEPGSAASSKWSVRSPIVMADYIRAAEEIFARRGPKRWKPVTEFLQLGGIQLFLHLVSSASTWNFVGRSEMVKACLDIIAICSTVGRVQENLCQFSSRLRQPLRANNLDEEYPQSPGPPCSGVTIILSATDGEVFRDADVQKSALLILIAILCCPRPSTDLPEGTQVRMSEVTRKAVNCVRRNHGILCLLKHLMAKSPLMEADCLRALACEALAGFAVKDESVRQILGKHFLFTSGQFQPLLREPLLQERKSEHARFVNCALDLMDAVSGGRRPLPPNPHEVSLDTLHRANIVAHTPIRFSSRDLATLIHRHLEEKGWRKAAEALAREAGLSPMGGSGPMPSPQIQSRSQGCSSSVSLRSPPPPDSTSPLPPPLSTPLRLNLVRLAPPRSTPKAAIVGCRPSLACTPCHPEAMIRQPQITLTDIINKYLMNQHALCRNPIATCPEFDLFSPHHCPEPQTRFKTPLNLAVRMQRRAIHPPDGGPHGAALTRKYIYSRFRPMMLHRNLENEDECCTCVAFTPYDPSCVYVGNENGDLKVVQIGSGHLETSYQCHDARLDKVYCNKDGSLVLTCSNRHSISLSSLWSVGEFFDLKFPLEGAEHSVFANESNKILCTRHEEADIVDIATGRTVLRLVPEENNYNGYLDNRAAFSPDDEMVLNDGLLWDVRSAKPIHKFDKFNSLVNGVFHPLGLEILSSSEVWDIRTFRLLHNVPSMDGCYPTFTSTGDVFFAFRHYYFDSEAMEDRETSFRSYDARDYSLIATTDVRKVVADLVVDPRDQHLAVVENSWDDNEGSGLDSIVRVYEIGRVREEDEAQDEEEGEGALSDDDDSSSDDEDEEGPGDRGEGRWIRQVLGAMSTENEALDSSRGEEGAGGEAEGDGRRSDSDDGTVLLSLSSDSDSVEDEEETSEEEDIDSDGLFSLGDDTTNDSYP